GAVVDPNMGDEIRITVIATGFDRPSVRSPLVEPRPAQKKEETASFPASSPAPKAERQAPPTSPTEFQPHVINTNDLDIPAFLRNRNTQR
ncbi:MAG: cell division protein FtsZ, partial [Bellilinea sp.]